MHCTVLGVSLTGAVVGGSMVVFDSIASISVGVLLGTVAVRLVNMNKRFLLGQSVDNGT